MNKLIRSKILAVFVVLGVLLTACSAPTSLNLIKKATQSLNPMDTISICHATGDADAPYELLTLTANDLTAHSTHSDDIIPAPAEGCPDELIPDSNDGKITICHATGNALHSYNRITIALSGLNGHSKHSDDFIPAPGVPCSSGTPTVTPTTTATMDGTPTETATVTITPTPEATQVGGDDGEKITICHATGNKKKLKYVEITISKNGLNGHDTHPNDIIPAPAGGCP